MPLTQVQQGMFGTNVAGNGPAFSAYQNSAQTLTTSATLIQFQTKEFDTATAFNNTSSVVGTAAAWSFNPQTAGYYIISGGISVSSSSTSILLSLYRDGVSFKVLAQPASANAAFGSTLVYFNGSTDYVQLYATLGTGQALTATAAATYFQASMVRSA